MKTLSLISLAVLVLAGCAKKAADTSNPVAPNPYANYTSLIVGKWQETADTTKIINNGVVTSTHINGLTTYYNQFNADGSGLEINSQASYNLSYKINNDKIVITYHDNVSETAKIKQLNQTTLSLYFDDISGAIETTEVIWFRKQ